MMRKLKCHIKIYFLSAILPFIAICPSQSQDTIRTEFRSDTVAVSTNMYDVLFNLMANDREEISTVYKINAVDWGMLQPSIIIEHAILKGVNLVPHIQLLALRWDMNEGYHFAADAGLQCRYYYNLSHRSRLGKNVNGFSGNYFALSVSYYLSDYKAYTESLMKKWDIDYAGRTSSDYYHASNLSIMYGIQRRFAGIGYIDGSVGAMKASFKDYSSSIIFPFFRLEIGFSLTKKTINDWVK